VLSTPLVALNFRDRNAAVLIGTAGTMAMLVVAFVISGAHRPLRRYLPAAIALVLTGGGVLFRFMVNQDVRTGGAFLYVTAMFVASLLLNAVTQWMTYRGWRSPSRLRGWVEAALMGAMVVVSVLHIRGAISMALSSAMLVTLLWPSLRRPSKA
jgi:hypothetical protein